MGGGTGKTKILWGKIIALVVGCTILDIVIHPFGPQQHYDFPPSVFMKTGLFMPALLILFLVTFGALSVVFSVIQERLPGRPLAKGFRYGVSFTGLWAIGILEWHVIFDSSLAYDLFHTALVDGGMILVLSLLLGKFVAIDSSDVPVKKSGVDGLAIVIIALLFIVGRFGNYSVLHIHSAYATKPLATFICVSGVGIWIGIMYLLLRQSVAYLSLVKRALCFGGLIFGTDWMCYMLFEILLIEIPLVDPFLRASGDIIFVTAGVLLFESIKRRLV